MFSFFSRFKIEPKTIHLKRDNDKNVVCKVNVDNGKIVLSLSKKDKEQLIAALKKC